MKKEHIKPEALIEKLGELSKILSEDSVELANKFKASLDLVRNVLKFDLSILYRVQNVVGNLLLLQVVEIDDPKNLRPDLYKDITIKINLNRPQPEYVNEAAAFNIKGISSINVPGEGSDLIGYIFTPDDIGGGYLFGGDYFGDEAVGNSSERKSFEIMCNLLSSVQMRFFYKKMATYDSLTGIFNSRYIREELAKVFSRFDRDNQRHISVVLGDIDFFKNVNDEYGHIQGDYVLKEIGTLLQSQMRLGFDVVGRYGGEEFLVIMEGKTEANCVQIVDRWRRAIEEHAFQRYGENGQKISGQTFNLTMSFGISTINDTYQNATELLADADKALYLAKETGRNRIVVANSLESDLTEKS